MSFSITMQQCQPCKDDVSRARVMSVGQGQGHGKVKCV